MSDLLTTAQIEELAEKINKKVNIPIISEKKEDKILVKLLTKIDDKVSESLPQNLKDIWAKIADGITQEEVDQLKGEIIKIANEKINIPILGKKAEDKIFTKLVDALFEVVLKKVNVKE